MSPARVEHVIMRRTFRATARVGCVFLLFAGFCGAVPAHADLYGAVGEYKKGAYSDAFKDFMALAKLGQPTAQLDVARLYFIGRGVRQNYIYAYAWAHLAAQNGAAGANEIADQLGPMLAPGSRQVAEQVTAAYTPDALGRTLLPEPLSPQAVGQQWQDMQKPPCWPVKVFDPGFPPIARMNKNQGRVLVEYTVMPDGTARLPRVLYAYPPQEFEANAREAALRSRYARRAGAAPLRCVEWEDFSLRDGYTQSGGFTKPNGGGSAMGAQTSGTAIDPNRLGGMRAGGILYFDNNRVPLPQSYGDLNRINTNLKYNADGGNDPRADLYYALLNEGAPELGGVPSTGLSWMVKAAQAGLPLAQFQVGYRLLIGLDCRPDPAKALKWLQMAAAKHETTADVILAVRLLSGTPDATATAAAKEWLEQAVAGGNEYGELYLSALLASAPEPQARDPKRALLLLDKIYVGVKDEPIAGEIRAAAQAGTGDFVDAIQSEQGAIAEAHKLGWDLAPLEQRLAVYAAHKPWYGDLLSF